MQNLDTKNKTLVLIILGTILAGVVWVNISDPLKTNAQNPKEPKIDEKFLDPTKDFKSLSNYITYETPQNWTANDQVDEEFGDKTNLSLSSPDFEASQSGAVKTGIKIWISRSYDTNPENTIANKLKATYPVYDYNILSTKIAGKPAMTLHEDLQGHNRFIYVAGLNHLWTITISSNSLEEEQKYESEIATFLNSIQFKD